MGTQSPQDVEVGPGHADALGIAAQVLDVVAPRLGLPTDWRALDAGCLARVAPGAQRFMPVKVEPKTFFANERTFSGWARTALATIGIGLGFHVLFGALEPAWLPKVIATVFIALGVVIIWMAERRACAIQSRLSAHKIRTLRSLNIRLIAWVYTLGALSLTVALWLVNGDAIS